MNSPLTLILFYQFFLHIDIKNNFGVININQIFLHFFNIIFNGKIISWLISFPILIQKCFKRKEIKQLK